MAVLMQLLTLEQVLIIHKRVIEQSGAFKTGFLRRPSLPLS